jgi:hypothetical protein
MDHVTLLTRDSSGNPAYMYVIGGRDAMGALDSIERAPLDPTDGSLTGDFVLCSSRLEDPVTHQSHARYGMGTSRMFPAIANRVYLFGGMTQDANGVRPYPGTDWATVDASGVLSTFQPHYAEFVSGRGNYSLGYAPDGAVYAIGGWPGIAGAMPAPTIERAIFR